jgi:hypothetical protein
MSAHVLEVLTLHEAVIAMDGDHSKHALLEARFDVAHAQRDVHQPMGANWLRRL